MTTITAKDVGELRKVTGAGLMDCKKALQESGGDFDGALDYLRKKGQKVAAKRADRETHEGVVIALVNEEGTRGLLMALSCETDFVAKNEDFVEFAERLARLAMDHGVQTKEQLLELEIDGTPVSKKLVEQTGVIGEKIAVSDFRIVEGKNIASYIHAGSKIGVLVAYADGGQDGAAQFFRNLAMHVAAMSPSILRPEEFDEELVQRETEALQGQIRLENEDRQRLGKPLRNVPEYASRRQLTPEVMARVEDDIKAELRAEGKPEKIWDKIIPGKLERFVADNTLLDQERCLLSQFYALDDTMTVEAAIRNFSPDAEILDFKRVAVG